jgi:hypothetical protein
LSFLQSTIPDRWHFVKTVVSCEASTIASIDFIGIPRRWLKSMVEKSVGQATAAKQYAANSNSDNRRRETVHDRWSALAEHQ